MGRLRSLLSASTALALTISCGKSPVGPGLTPSDLSVEFTGDSSKVCDRAPSPCACVPGFAVPGSAPTASALDAAFVACRGPNDVEAVETSNNILAGDADTGAIPD